MPTLVYREAKTGTKSKVVNQFWETICECYPDQSYSDRYKHTLNEMIHAWNESFGRGLDVRTGFKPFLKIRPDVHTYLVDGKEFHSIEQVEKYAKSIGKRIILTQTKIDSNIYLVTLTK